MKYPFLLAVLLSCTGTASARQTPPSPSDTAQRATAPLQADHATPRTPHATGAETPPTLHLDTVQPPARTQFIRPPYLRPGDTVDQIETLIAAKKSKENLAFVGDGINDAPVLSRADVGIAMGALGSDAAIEAADVVLMDDDPAKIALAMRIARRTLRIVYQNIVFALAIKFACLVLGALGLASMWTAIFADVGVMVLAVLNATRALYTKDLAKKNVQ